MAWAHPRSRGENRSIAGAAGFAQGSSPLTRGKPPTLRERGPWLGLIPAHAGKTSSSAICSLWTQAHPRSRGENRFHDRGRGHADGSSPLTRGKHEHERIHSIVTRLIPAHAGKTKATRSPRRTNPAHPRSRGENTTAALIGALTPGSSPLTRGKRPATSLWRPACRLIPAHAGKTCMPGIGHERTPAHPRSRGENGERSGGVHHSPGSSPLTRGKPLSLMMCISAFRLIPAHAGKTRVPAPD